jgi:hypothetical protein
MNDMTIHAKTKAEKLTSLVTSDPRWDLNDELQCQIFGFTMFGCLYGLGRMTCFMDVEDIRELAASQLISLGIGPNYAQGMMSQAQSIATTEGDTTIYSQLIGIGHSHFGSEDMTELVDSIFSNTASVRESQS